MDEGSSQAMLIAATTGLSAGIEAGYGIALHVDYLGSPVDPETTVRIVPDGIERRRVEWRFFDLVHGRIRPPRELRIATLVHVRVPLRHRFHQVSERNSLELMTAVDLLGQLLDRIGAEEEDRKSTRLNSSHSQISYAVFCLKKKKPIHILAPTLAIIRLLCLSTKNAL